MSDRISVSVYGIGRKYWYRYRYRSRIFFYKNIFFSSNIEKKMTSIIFNKLGCHLMTFWWQLESQRTISGEKKNQKIRTKMKKKVFLGLFYNMAGVKWSKKYSKFQHQSNNSRISWSNFDDSITVIRVTIIWKWLIWIT